MRKQTSAPMSRTLQSVLDELRDEHHVPMVAFLELLAQHEWARRLRYDLSMLRLWVSRENAPGVEAMVVYGDGHGGGRPVAPDEDVYETTIFNGAHPGERRRGNRVATVDVLRASFETAGNGA